MALQEVTNQYGPTNVSQSIKESIVPEMVLDIKDIW